MILKLYETFEIKLSGSVADSVLECAEFTDGLLVIKCNAFRISNNEFAIRFMPVTVGNWNYIIKWNKKEIRGSIKCVKGNSDGPVDVEGMNFRHRSGKQYIPFGTTCYAWTHQNNELQIKTLKSLKISPFNKIRMCVFPKAMVFNKEEPDELPFKYKENKWCIDEINPNFWNNLDMQVCELAKIGIQAELILLHPYDRWGFKLLNQTQILKYLKYVVTRYSAFSNVWWSLANEYEMLYNISWDEWDTYGEYVHMNDEYNHLLSVHNILKVYPRREWMTHCSIQSTKIDNIINWRNEYSLPVIIDEFGYEGNIDYMWGNLSAREFTDRMWKTICRGGYFTHGETFMDPNDILWWSKGGTLKGKSVERIVFLKDLLYSLDCKYNIIYNDVVRNPNTKKEEMNRATYHHTFKSVAEELPKYQQKELMFVDPIIIQNDNFMLRYMGMTTQVLVNIDLPYISNKIEIIDTWNMKILEYKTIDKKNIDIKIPEIEGIAVLIKNIK